MVGMLVPATLLSLTAAAGGGPPVGKASGTLSVDTVPVTFTAAYAQLQLDGEGGERLAVVLAESALPEDLLNGWNSLGDVLGSAGVSGLHFFVTANGSPEGWRFVHPGLSSGCYICSGWTLTVSARDSTSIAGSVATSGSEDFQGREVDFRGAFAVPIMVGRDVATFREASPAQKAARLKLGEMGWPFSPAMFFAMGHDPETVKVFLDAGMPPDTAGPGGDATLLSVVLSSPSPDETDARVARLLLAAGADPRRDGGALLARAAVEPEIGAILRDAGVPVESGPGRVPAEAPPAPGASSASDARSRLAGLGIEPTAESLWNAVTERDEEGVLLLLLAGQSPNVRREPPQSDTPLQFATSTCHLFDGETNARTVRIALALLEHGADANAADTNGAAPLIAAAQTCPAELVRALVKAGARLDVKAAGGATPMMMAVVMGRADNVEALLDAGYRVDDELDMLLTIASGKPEIESLLRRGSREKR